MRKLLLALVLSLAATCAAYAQGGLYINQLPAGQPLQGSELFPMFQGTQPAKSISATVMKQFFTATGVAGGDLSGNYPNPTVVGLQGQPVSNTPPTANQCLVYQGSFPSGTWQPGPCAQGSVASFNGRTGVVVPVSGDYSFSLVSGLLGCAQLPVFSGDWTQSACVVTISAGAVTNSKMAVGAAAANLNLGAGVGTFLTTPNSANLAGALTDETGSGAAVFANSPVMVTPNLGTPSVLTLTNATGLPFAGIASGALATAAQYMAGNASTLVTPAIAFTSEVAITFAASQTIDFSTFIDASITLTANMTSMSLSNIKAGQAGVIRFIQDATGGRTIASAVWPSTFKFANGGTHPTLSTAANAVDALAYQCISSTYCIANLLNNVQ